MLMLLLLAAAADTSWPAYGNDPGGSRYSPLTQITRENVSRLKLAWTHRTGALDTPGNANRKSAFEATPILVDGTLYLSTPFNQVIALDPETGERKWIFDPGVDRSKYYSEVTSRGVSAWFDPQARAWRLFMGTIDARLIALDAATGRPMAGFGKNGEIDLSRDVELKDAGDYQVTSPPAIINGIVVAGSSIGDNRRFDVERGIVRAFDVRTGAQRWSWDPLPNAGGSGAANAWSVISADPKRDLVFVPTSSPAPDYFGGRRKGDNRYANSVVALHASTGKVAWSFQVVHHDLWDYDVASQPNLVSIRRNGRDIDAVAVTTKIGHLFVLDRVTGKPLHRVEERPVPKSDIPGEYASPTQPFPATPPLAPQGLTPADAWGATAEERKWCEERIRSFRSEGLFTPPSLKGSIAYPANAGGVAWGGAAYDPKRGWLVVNTNRLPGIMRLIPRDDFDATRTAGRDNRLQGEFAPQRGTPFGMYREFILAPSGLPCNGPPWGALAAVDLATGGKRWEVPLGTVPLPSGPIDGSPNLGGPLITAGGLIFIAAARGDNQLRAFDIQSGRVVWETTLPAGGQATPMSYSIGGKQYIVIAAGGHGKLGTKLGDYVVAFALGE